MASTLEISEVQGLTPVQRAIRASMTRLLGRAGLEYRGGYVDAGGHRVHYLDYGSGPPVLLVHGGGAGGAMWFRQIAALSRRFRVIAPDNPVFGLSSQPAYPVPVYDITSGYLLSFMDALGIEKASLAGLSMGGFAAASLAVEAPHRTDRLVLINSAGFGRDLPWGFRLTSLPGLGHLLSRPNRWAHQRFFVTNEVFNADGPDNQAYLEYAYLVTTNTGHAEAVRRNMPAFAGLRGQRLKLLDDELLSIRARTLVIWGREDRFFPLSHARRAEQLIPQARLEVLQDCGHIAMLDQPDAVSGLISGFLEH